jgi:hypothetical protein
MSMVEPERKSRPMLMPQLSLRPVGGGLLTHARGADTSAVPNPVGLDVDDRLGRDPAAQR